MDLKISAIQKEFLPVLTDFIEDFTLNFAGNIHSIYVYGSVANLQAIIGQSDLDLCVVFRTPANVNDARISTIKSRILERYSFIPKLDIDYGDLTEVLQEKNKQRWGVWLKFFCKRIYGEDLALHFEDVEINRQSIAAINQGFDDDIQNYLNILKLAQDNQYEHYHIQKSLIKRILRLLPLTLTHVDTWPLSLQETVEQNVRYFPEQKKNYIFY